MQGRSLLRALTGDFYYVLIINNHCCLGEAVSWQFYLCFPQIKDAELLFLSPWAICIGAYTGLLPTLLSFLTSLGALCVLWVPTISHQVKLLKNIFPHSVG